MGSRILYLPPQFAVHTGVLGNPVRQLLRPAFSGSLEIEPYAKRGVTGEIVREPDSGVILVVDRPIKLPDGVTQMLLFPAQRAPANEAECLAAGRTVRWVNPLSLKTIGSPSDAQSRCDAARDSWRDQFAFREEAYEGGTLVCHGLRPPQIGALYMTLGHWKAGIEPATIVMPTGTGKTETMVALLAKERLACLLVIVPTDPLRDQVASKFLSFGLLKAFGVVGQGAAYPVVGVLRKRPRSAADVAQLFGCCNVVVTTMAVVGGCAEDVQAAIAAQASHLFIDEAHHISAPTWRRFRDACGDKPILQFTATPFRGDGKHVDGKVIFNYPLRKAQAEGYFTPITFRPITAYDRDAADLAIATMALQQFEADRANGRDHLVMARVGSIARAEQVHGVYQKLAAALRPLLLHSDLSAGAKATAMEQLRSRASRVIVCVDMLGEGFDLPELKIAALHDMHKSLAITLQFTGRFTRAKPHLGTATMVANVADPDVEDSLKALYAEDADWNQLLRQLSEGATGKQARRAEFLAAFQGGPIDIPLQNIFPKMSTVVYRTGCTQWKPENYVSAFRESLLDREPAINARDRVLVFVTRVLDRVPWGDIRGIHNVTWDLYVVHWDQVRGLLFINSSNNDGVHEELAKAVAGPDVSIIRGELVYRSFYNLRRIILTNLGLNHSLSRAVRFTWYVGSDIREGLSEAHLHNKTKSNIFGRGFEDGEKVTIGCSRKGRIWSYKVAGDIPEWVEWCQSVGGKLLNEQASWAEVLPHVIKPEPQEKRPDAVPLVIEWSEAFLQHSEDVIRVEMAGKSAPLIDVGLELVDHTADQPIRFRLTSGGTYVEYELAFSGTGDKARVDYRPTGAVHAYLTMGRARKEIGEWFQEEPPIVRFADGSFLIYNELFRINSAGRVPFDPARIEAWVWTGVDLKKESQTPHKLADSIQYHVIQALLAKPHDPPYAIVFDDDDSNEAADIVAIAVKDDRLIIHLFHCKYSKEATPGARVDDLYAVCGQAQRSVHWKDDIDSLFEHLKLRDARRRALYNVSRFELGDLKTLAQIQRRLPYLNVELAVAVVQPGLSAQKAEATHLDLLATTELYLRETRGIGLRVIASA